MKVLALVLLVATAYAKHEEYQGWRSYYVTPSTQLQLSDLRAMAAQFDLDFITRATLDRQNVILVKPQHQTGFSRALAEKKIHFRVNPVDVKRWRSYYVTPSTQLQLSDLRAMAAQFDLDFITRATLDRQNVILVKPQHQTGFSRALAEKKIHFRVNPVDVKSQLDIDDQRMEKQKTLSENLTMSYDNYQPIEVIDKYLQDIAKKYPDIVTLVTPDNSFEGHPIQYLKISKTNFEVEKPIIFINSGINAREWIGPPTVTYAIRKLVEDLAEDESDLLEEFDWILLPVANPDGYKYTATNRFWHKNRSTDQHPGSVNCPGVDIDRNFDFHWGTVGTSDNPCDDNFPGSEAWSEVESRVIRDILLVHELHITLYISMHSYGSFVLYPWGHDGSLPGNALALHTVGINMVDAIHQKALDKFKRYTVGNSVQVTQKRTSGSSKDYANSLGIPLTYDIELPGLDEGLEGFHLPPEYIKQVVEETWAGIVVGARRSAELFWDQD